ncbi:MAG: hypothetical protein KDK65_06270, partial [Chlamydiia bacterium]|nr:hypothetical protein [Chlamydiia bacterium]
MSWQVDNRYPGPLSPEMLDTSKEAYGASGSASTTTTSVAQSALEGSGLGSSGNDSPPAVQGTPPVGQVVVQSGKPLPRPPTTSSSSSSSKPSLNEVLANASQALAAVPKQQARLAPLFASTPATAAASTSTPATAAASTSTPAPADQASTSIPRGECFTYKGKDYHIPGMIGHSGTSVTFKLADERDKETVDIATMCTLPITFREGFHPSFKIHMLLENKRVPFDTMKALLHPDFVP